jgi:FixJ family two-component response regulator
VLLVTGYAETGRINGQIDNARVLKKPYRMAELADAVERALRDNRQDAAANVVALRAVEE